MLGFWAKAFIATVIVCLAGYGVFRLWMAHRGCLTLTFMLLVFLISPILWLIAYYNFPIYYLEPYKGRVVESGTGKPIPGAAVMVMYYEIGPAVHGTMTSYIDVKEAKTDEMGEYHIPSEWRLRRGGTPYGRITIFKPGNAVKVKYNVNFLETIFWPDSDHRYWNTGYQIYELNQLKTNQERIDNLHKIDTIGADHDKIEYMLILKEQERINVGFKPRRTSEMRKKEH